MKANNNSKISLEVYFVTFSRSDKAAGIHHNDAAKKADVIKWLPLSLCSMTPERPERGQVVTVSVPEWLAVQEGMV